MFILFKKKIKFKNNPLTAFFLLAVVCLPLKKTILFSQIPTEVHVAFDQENRTASLRALSKGEVVYVSLNGFAELLKLKYFPNDKNQKTVVRVGSKTIKLTASNPFIVIDDVSFQMPLPRCCSFRYKARTGSHHEPL